MPLVLSDEEYQSGFTPRTKEEFEADIREQMGLPPIEETVRFKIENELCLMKLEIDSVFAKYRSIITKLIDESSLTK
jgi:hypothetical protein